MTADEELAHATAHDLARAGERGERLQRMANDVVSKLLQAGLLKDPRSARVLTFHILADWLYGNKSIDIPTTLGEP
jgi:hypothetical protein